MLDNDVSMHNLVVLVVLIPTSPRSSKTESGCKIYRVSRACCFTLCISSGIFWVIPDSSEFSGSIPDGFRGEPVLLSVSVSEYSGPFRTNSGRPRKLHNGQILLTYKKGASSPKVPQPLELFFTPIVDLFGALPSLFLHDSCLHLVGKERGDLDPHFQIGRASCRERVCQYV